MMFQSKAREGSAVPLPLSPAAQISAFRACINNDRTRGTQNRTILDLRQMQRAGKEILIVGDLHARHDNLDKILSFNDNGGKIERGEAVLVLLGDIVHREDPTGAGEMHTSINMLRRVMDMKIRNPSGVYLLLGNHEFLDNGHSKHGIVQGHAFRSALQNSFGGEFVSAYRGAIEALPVMAIGDGFALVHGGPVTGIRSLNEVYEAKAEDSWNCSSIVKQATANRMYNDYFPEDVSRFLELCGQPDGVLLAGHSPGDGTNWAWTMPGVSRQGNPNHYIVHAGNERTGYVRIGNGRITFQDTTCPAPLSTRAGIEDGMFLRLAHIARHPLRNPLRNLGILPPRMPRDKAEFGRVFLRNCNIIDEQLAKHRLTHKESDRMKAFFYRAMKESEKLHDRVQESRRPTVMRTPALRLPVTPDRRLFSVFSGLFSAGAGMMAAGIFAPPITEALLGTGTFGVPGVMISAVLTAAVGSLSAVFWRDLYAGRSGDRERRR